ncbi:unnamed protein product (macronuclear) [Paramecium tetraurelia]|uniref:Transmembrane protein n=1 Tax=Paramecium tetraurelia TaxID=5888 RepID=A0E4R6_PARTE|nr:uncharacterized protein GSPATT00023458001 [Paramecium tetraurelia]CAK90283.1 unnamed protein product [Paramecium tetraurelia]|eukprot:XP_001457680.1 hypothetical protein (macronuclear) [Paramecium tetraurelia strain d4-2]
MKQFVYFTLKIELSQKATDSQNYLYFQLFQFRYHILKLFLSKQQHLFLFLQLTTFYYFYQEQFLRYLNPFIDFKEFLGLLQLVYSFQFIFCHMYYLSIYLFQSKHDKYFRGQCHQNFNLKMSIVLGCSIILSYAIVDILVIYCRIVLFRYIVTLMKEDEFNPINRFFYFFIQHNKLSEIFLEYTVI